MYINSDNKNIVIRILVHVFFIPGASYNDEEWKGGGWLRRSREEHVEQRDTALRTGRQSLDIHGSGDHGGSPNRSPGIRQHLLFNLFRPYYLMECNLHKVKNVSRIGTSIYVLSTIIDIFLLFI